MRRIVIADDHTIFRLGVKNLVQAQNDLQVVAEFGNVAELLTALKTLEWDLLLLDLNMPGGDSLDALREIACAWPKRPVLVLSMHPEEQFAVRVIKAGAAGYLAKESAPDELVRAIRHVLLGRKYITAVAAEQMAGGQNDQPPHELLTDREFEVLRLIASGKTPTEVAKILSLSVKTVSTYRSRILEKLHLTTSAAMTTYAIRNRLVD